MLVKAALPTVVFLLDILVKVKKKVKRIYFQISCYHYKCWSKMFGQLLSYFGAFGKGKKRVERMDDFRVMNLDC